MASENDLATRRCQSPKTQDRLGRSRSSYSADCWSESDRLDGEACSEWTTYPTILLFCSLRLLHCPSDSLFCSLRLLHCPSGSLFCSLRLLHCPGDSLFCSLRLLHCPSGSLFCSLRLLHCPGDSLFCSLRLLHCPGDSLFCSLRLLHCPSGSRVLREAVRMFFMRWRVNSEYITYPMTSLPFCLRRYSNYPIFRQSQHLSAFHPLHAVIRRDSTLRGTSFRATDNSMTSSLTQGPGDWKDLMAGPSFTTLDVLWAPKSTIFPKIPRIRARLTQHVGPR